MKEASLPKIVRMVKKPMLGRIKNKVALPKKVPLNKDPKPVEIKEVSVI